MKLKQNEKGISLVQVMMAMAIAGGLGLVLMRISQNATQITINLDTRTEIALLWKQINSVIEVSHECDVNLQNLDLPGDATPTDLGDELKTCAAGITDPTECLQDGNNFSYLNRTNFNNSSPLISIDNWRLHQVVDQNNIPRTDQVRLEVSITRKRLENTIVKSRIINIVSEGSTITGCGLNHSEDLRRLVREIACNGPGLQWDENNNVCVGIGIVDDRCPSGQTFQGFNYVPNERIFELSCQ